METRYVMTKNETGKRMTKFWGKLFLDQFCHGRRHRHRPEFQFGMNWSEYSRFMGDIFGAPLAIEALLAFFDLPSWCLDLRLGAISPGLHAGDLAGGVRLERICFVDPHREFLPQQPVGYAINHGRAEMIDFLQLVLNPHIFTQRVPDTVLAGFCTAAFFVMSIKKRTDVFIPSFKIAAVFCPASTILVIGFGHLNPAPGT